MLCGRSRFFLFGVSSIQTFYFLKYPGVSHLAALQILAGLKSFFLTQLLQIQAFFGVILKTWPVYDHVATWERRKKVFGNTTGSVCGALSKSAQLFANAVDKSHICGPLTPLPQFLFRSMLCAFRLNACKLALSVWKMHFLFSHLPFILCQGSGAILVV